MTMPLVIDEMFAFVAKNDEGEGLMGVMGKNNVFMPLVGADLSRVDSLYSIAKKVSEKTGVAFKILKFSTREDITDAVVSRIDKKET